MNRFVFILTLVAAVSASAAPAANPAAATQALVMKNNARCHQLKREVESSWNWHVAKKAKDFPALEEKLAEMEKLATLPEGAASEFTPGKVKLLRAFAYARPLNLRYYEKALAEFDAAIKAAADAKERTVAEYEKAKYVYEAGQDEKAVEPKPPEAPTARQRFDELMSDTSFGSWNSVKGDPLDEKNALDWKLARVEAALGDGAFASWREALVDRKVSLLAGLGRWDESEKLIKDEIAKLDEKQKGRRAALYRSLGAQYLKRAERYYARPDAQLVDRAIGFYEEALANGGGGNDYNAVITALFLLGDYARASAYLDRYAKECFRDGKGESDPWIAGCRGDLAYYAGDYAKAVDAYEKGVDPKGKPGFRDAPSFPKIPNSHQRYTGALHALGQYEKCLKSLDQCPGYWSFKDQNAYFRRILQKKIDASRGRLISSSDK